MTLAALIAAYHEADEAGGGLRATLPLAGRTLLERQARLAVAAGADLIVVAVERVPPDLLAAIDRLRGQGIKVAVARNAIEAAEAVHPQDQLLIMADGLIATETHIERLTALGGSAILTVPDVRVDDRYERIDAHSRWAGLALLDGETLKRTAAMLGEWDLQSTLLRRAIQAGIRQMSVRGEPVDDLLTIAERGDDLAALQQRLFEGAGAQRSDWVSRYLLGPLEQAATRRLMPTNATPGMLGLGAALLTAFAALSFASGWLLTGMVFLLLATPLDGIGERLASLRMQDTVSDSWWATFLPGIAAAALVALGFALAGTGTWGFIALAFAIIAFTVALRTEAAGRDIPRKLWLAERKGMSWLLLPFAATGLWGTGLTLLALYAGGSFFWAQRHVHKAASAP
ncbi:beta/alpha barrel domain-containing protein [Allosphingosinicella deserti]|uniref:Uncharacterized protein n=1 Tax=Allosphingosinicella deserti TaxID=2116704 RepID=A0A2P7QPB4_9SPHN|nr:hypothetical protein [Sphingomonas deserti]PSJ39797.1 hypothetical protein C7I55_14580 [Sphingomonas deserti]